jgi:biotin carboxyl carrier protein
MKIFVRSKSGDLVLESRSENGRIILTRDGRLLNYDLVKIGSGRYSLLVDNKSYIFRLKPDDQDVEVHISGDVFRIRVEDERLRALNELVNLSGTQVRELDIKAPIPGLVVKVSVKPGDTVRKDDALLVLEAMKMENVIKAPHDAEVLEVAIQEKESVTKGQVLINLKSMD